MAANVKSVERHEMNNMIGIYAKAYVDVVENHRLNSICGMVVNVFVAA